VDLTDAELKAAMDATRAAWRAANPGVTDAAMPAALRDAAKPHAGLLVALWLSGETAAQLAIPGGEPAKELHVTLCYCGDTTEMDDLTLFRAVAAVDRSVSYSAPLVGKIAGYGRFNASETSDGRDVFYAAVDIPALAELRQGIANELTWAGCPPRATHGFTPHCTLAYLDPGAANPVEAVPSLPLRFDAVTVKMGDQGLTIPLNGIAGPLGMVEACDRESGTWALFNELQAYADAPDWAPFLPQPGQYSHPLYGQINLTPERIDRFVDQFKAGVYQDKLPVDAEHDLSMSGAVGWITDMRVNADGSADARVDWNDRGKALIEGDRFRYVSPSWRETWQDPVTDEVYRDVAIGLAITTRPFFKERSGLRPLVASEGQLSAPDPRDGGQTVTWRRDAAEAGKDADVSDTDKDKDKNVAPVALTEEQARRFADLETRLAEREQAFSEQATKLSELEAAKTASEAKVTALEADQAALKAEAQQKRFSDLVRGRGGAGDGVAWVGQPEDNVASLTRFAEVYGEDSDQFRAEVAHRQKMAQQFNEALKPIGTSERGEPAGGAWDRIEQKARAMTDADPKLTHQQAIEAVMEREPALYAEYEREQR